MKRIPDKEAEEAMISAGFSPLAPYPGGDYPWKCLCLSCGEEIFTALHRVKAGHGCPRCWEQRRASIPYSDEARLICNTCGEEKTGIELGHRINGRGEKVLLPKCRKCRHKALDKKKKRASSRKSNEVVKKRRAELTKSFLASQGNVCALCGISDPGVLGWHLDHDHGCCQKEAIWACGQCYRGVLCAPCNIYLVATLEKYQSLLPAAFLYLNWSLKVGN